MKKTKLNKMQRQAVQENTGPVLVFAGAGSGKTRVLTHKIYQLIKVEGYKPQNILSVPTTTPIKLEGL